MMLYAFVLRDQAVTAQEEADYQRTLADSSANIAVQERSIAEAQADTALMQKALADSATLVAIANQQLAARNAAEAERQSLIAQDSAEAAQQQRNIALQQQAEAERQRLLALEASDEAYRRQVLSVAQSMAVKSLQVDNDTSLKTLLAFQAYLFNNNYKGPSHHADIYAGLYDALKFINGNSYNVYTGHTGAVRSLVFAPDSRLFYSAGSDGSVRQWDMEEKTNQVIIENQLVNSVIDISNDGTWLACGTDGEGIQLFRADSPGEPRMLTGEDDHIRTIDFLPGNDRMFSAGVGGQITLWDLQSGRSEVFASTGSPVDILVVSRDGNWLAAGTRDGRIIIWAVNNADQPFVLHEQEGNSVYALDFNPDGTLLASGDENGNVIVWDFSSRSQLNNLRGHRAQIRQLKFSPDGSLLASSSYDESVRIWETADLNNQPIVLNANSGYIFSVAFSPDSKSLITGSRDEDRLVLSPTRAEYMVGDICSKLDRNFTTPEWNAYVGTDIPYEDTCGEAPSIGIRRSDDQQ
jgi:WD40 repeat protein